MSSLEPDIALGRSESSQRVCAPGARTYWVITVKDPGDLEAGVIRYERRFEFDDLEEAYRCAQGADQAGFEIAVAKVFATRDRLSSTMTGSSTYIKGSLDADSVAHAVRREVVTNE